MKPQIIIIYLPDQKDPTVFKKFISEDVEGAEANLGKLERILVEEKRKKSLEDNGEDFHE